MIFIDQSDDNLGELPARLRGNGHDTIIMYVKDKWELTNKELM